MTGCLPDVSSVEVNLMTYLSGDADLANYLSIKRSLRPHYNPADEKKSCLFSDRANYFECGPANPSIEGEWE
jgi:hypothetical protein